jgi:rod shape-determining protein MreD
MIRHFKYFLFALLLMIIQTKVMSVFSLEGITPDLLLIWLIYVAIKNGQLTATVWGFAIGIMFDMATGNFIGLSALSKTIAGFIAGYFYNENKATMTLGSYRFVIIVLLTSFVHNAIYFTAFTRGSEIGLWRAIFLYGLATTFYTAAVTLLPMFIFARKYIR